MLLEPGIMAFRYLRYAHVNITAPNKKCSRRHFIFFLLLSFGKIRLDVSCESSASSHEISSLIFSEKIQWKNYSRLSSAAVVIGALRINITATTLSLCAMSVKYQYRERTWFFYALTFARSRGRCLKLRPWFFKTFRETWQTLMFWKILFNRCYCISSKK